MLLPQAAADGTIEWKIWTLGTWLQGLDDFPEDESLLQRPSNRKWKTAEDIVTDVVIIGGEHVSASLAAR